MQYTVGFISYFTEKYHRVVYMILFSDVHPILVEILVEFDPPTHYPFDGWDSKERVRDHVKPQVILASATWYQR